MRGDFRLDSNDNTLFTTARCNNNCIMCCQPPLKDNDIDELFIKNIEIIERSPKDIPVVGISGGEPTLLGEKLIHLIQYIRKELPESDIHILSNGRNFCDAEYAKAVLKAGEGKIVVGIPFHSDYYKDHETIAGKKEAYNETLTGLYNLAAFGAEIELRIVINKLNYNRLPQMADFIFKNLPFVAWTAFMAMEHIGHAVTNEKNVWIEPIDYMKELEEAVVYLNQWKKDVAIYNIPLCLLPDRIHSFAKQSISDWKNKYLSVCENCIKKSECCGFFATSKKTFKGVEPFINL